MEVTTEYEAGLDFTVNLLRSGSWFKSITASPTYWTRKSSNVIYTVNTAVSKGITGGLDNAIDMSSNGFQFSLNIPVVSTNALSWDFTTNFGHQISKIDRIAGGAPIVLTSAAGSTSLVLQAGQQIGQIYAFKALTNVNYTNQEGVPYISAANQSNYQLVNGRVVDKTTYQMQFTNETYPIGNPNPKFNASFINTVRFKDFVTLSFQFDWIHGTHLYNQTKEWMYRDGISGDFAKSVNINGESGAYTAYWSSAYYNLWGSTHGAGNNTTKDFFWENASFVRLRNISLAFDVARFIKVQALHKVQIVFTGRNILTFTKYTGMDPEISSGQVNSSFDRGVDHSTLPNIKSYQVGLNVAF